MLSGTVDAANRNRPGQACARVRRDGCEHDADSARFRGSTGPALRRYSLRRFNVFVLIDAGANIDARPEHLLQYVHHRLGNSQPCSPIQKAPWVGLISLGEEDVKGNDLTKEAFKMLKKSSLNFRGNIGKKRHYLEDPVEVVVCDRVCRQCDFENVRIDSSGDFQMAQAGIDALLKFTWLRAYLARKAFRVIKDKTNYEEYGGMPLLGVNGICIIAHGASTPLAIKTRYEWRRVQVNSR